MDENKETPQWQIDLQLDTKKIDHEFEGKKYLLKCCDEIRERFFEVIENESKKKYFLIEKQEQINTRFKNKDYNFSYCIFICEAYFNKFDFEGDAIFWSSIFEAYANFNGANFTKEATFFRTHFTKEASFTGAEFTGEANFFGAIFAGGAYFIEAKFTGEASFIGTKFAKEAYFNSTHFTGTVDFNNATFLGFTRFSFANIKKYFILHKINNSCETGFRL